MEARRRWVAAGALVFTSLLWGSQFPVVALAVHHEPPLAFLTWRLALAAALMLPLWRGGLRSALPGLLTGMANGLALLCQTEALAFGSPDLAAFLTALSVVAVPLLRFPFLRRLEPPVLPFSLALAVSGLYLVTGVHGLRAPRLAVVFGLLTALLAAVQVIGTGHSATRVGGVRAAVHQVAGAAAAILLLTLVAQPADLAPPPVEDWGAIAYMATAVTVLAYGLQSLGQSRLDPTVSALIFALEPVFGAAFAYLLVGQRLGPRALAGAGLIFLSTVLAVLGPDPRRMGRRNRSGQVTGSTRPF